MFRVLAFYILCLCSSSVFASANASVSERETLLGLSDSSYYVVSVEVESKISHFETYQRVLIKRYDLDSNRLISESILSNTLLSTNPDSIEQSIEKIGESQVDLGSLLSSDVINYSGYGVKPAKRFTFDEHGVYLMSGGNRDYVLSLKEIMQRIPTYNELLQYSFTMPEVVAVHSEPTRLGVRYFVVVRSGDFRSDVSSFERVISLPEE